MEVRVLSWAPVYIIDTIQKYTILTIIHVPMTVVPPNADEARAIDDLYDAKPLSNEPVADEDKLYSYLRIAMEATLMQKSYAFRADGLEQGKKNDSSNVTEADTEIERYIRDSLLTAFPDDGFHGEETERVHGANGKEFVLDPVDGTTSLLYFEQRSGLSFAQVDGNSVPFGLVSHAVAGEIAYAIDNQRTRLIQLGIRKSETQIRELPVKLNPAHRMTVITQVGKSGNHLREKLLTKWHSKDIYRPQQLFGSPAVAILDATRGKTVAVLQWLGGGRPTDPYDFAAAFKVVKNAGGEIILSRANKHGLRREHTKILDSDQLTTAIPNNGVIVASGTPQFAKAAYSYLLPDNHSDQ